MADPFSPLATGPLAAMGLPMHGFGLQGTGVDCGPRPLSSELGGLTVYLGRREGPQRGAMPHRSDGRAAQEAVGGAAGSLTVAKGRS